VNGEQRPSEPEDLRERAAAELDGLAAVPDEVLSELVARHGLCLWEITSGDPPVWSGDGPPDRELAARLCASCPVRRECLEFELRTAGADTVGVWGGLGEDDRRALHAIWAVRAARRTRSEGDHDEHDEPYRRSGREGGDR
jgi:WhiB family redox-sensing transcriptional regulator